jgi:hypothetical protein
MSWLEDSMPVSVGWYKEDQIILVSYSDYISAEQNLNAIQAFQYYLDKANHPLHAIADWRHAENYPIDISLTSKLLPIFRHQNMGWFAALGVNSILSYWVEFFGRVGGLRCIVCPSLEDAVVKLNEKDQAATR